MLKVKMKKIVRRVSCRRKVRLFLYCEHCVSPVDKVDEPQEGMWPVRRTKSRRQVAEPRLVSICTEVLTKFISIDKSCQLGRGRCQGGARGVS